MMKNVLLTIAYDGTDFHGWQRQPGLRTVQGELERVLSILCGYPVTIDGTGRTDAGVHALGQRATFQGEFSIPVERIPLAANNLLSGGMNTYAVGDVRILSCEEMPEGFHARFSCKGKKYIYRLVSGKEINIFSRNYCWQIRDSLDLPLMRAAAEIMTGTHDFKCFQAAGGEEKETTIRTISSIDIEERDGEISIGVIGDGFLYNMVRIITGTLVEVGRGRMEPEHISEIITKKDRTLAGPTAPPQGLYLAEVYF